MKILIMGLPGAGKTWLAERLQKYLECAWYNADKVRSMANDWDFSAEGRIRQSNRMKTFADFEKQNNRYVICDFVCPTQNTRDTFDPDIVIWLNTIQQGRFEDTNAMFEKPKLVDYQVDTFLSDSEIEEIAKDIKKADV
jgi:adenylylsulfate kinase